MFEKLLKHGKKILIGIFAIGLVIRFLFFPDNIYFGFDQARDAFKSLDITKGDFQILGPSTSLEGLYHGVYYYYLLAPIYLLGQGDPRILSFFLRVANALGIFVIFYFAQVLFRKKEERDNKFALLVGLVSALLFAFSFEQTQFSIYMGNPTLASISVMLIYLGLAMVIFKNNYFGLLLAAFMVGLSIQFEFALFYLIAPVLVIIGVFYKVFIKVPIKIWGLSVIAFLISVASFILAELMYDFRTLRTLTATTGVSADRSITAVSESFFQAITTMNKLNFWGELPYPKIGLLVMLGIFIFLVFRFKEYRKQLGFLVIWFFGLFLIYLLGGGNDSLDPLYYTNIGIAPALTLFISLALGLLIRWNIFVGLIPLLFLLVLNSQMILKYNPHSTITSINVQQGMLLKDELAIIDTTYQEAKGEPFSVKSLSMPLNINTTWSYLYSWYGKNKYGYTPVWGGPHALGYPNELEVNTSQSELPQNRFSIIEPVRGIREYDIQDYFKTEDIFTNLEWEKDFGAIKLQKRIVN